MSLFPHRAELEADLAAKMKEKGFDFGHPLIPWNGTLLDGYHRLRAAQTATLKKVYVVEKEFDSEDDEFENLVSSEKTASDLGIGKRKVVDYRYIAKHGTPNQTHSRYPSPLRVSMTSFGNASCLAPTT